MKKQVTSTLAVIFLFSGILFAQTKFAVVDSDYMLNKIPEYASAQNTLDELALEWQQEIEKKFAEIDKMYKAYQQEAVLLPEDMKVKRQDEIIKKEKEVKDLQKKRFGTDGDLFKKRQELIKPIQEKISGAIEEFANEGNYSIIFDRANSTQIMFVSSKIDKSDEVLKKLGY